MTDFAPAPLLDARLRLQQASPFCRVMGVELLEWGRGRAVTRMPAGPRVTLSEDDGRIDPLAIIGLLDDAFGNAIGSVVPITTGIATLDLRIDFATGDMPLGAVTANTQVIFLDRHSATARAQARSETGAAIAMAAALFTLGGFPGGAAPDFDRIGSYDASGKNGPFRDLLGLAATPDGPSLRGDNSHLVGMETGAALHGGAVGALLMAACQQCAAAEIDNGKRLASLAIRYFRPGSALRPLDSTSRIERQGRSATFVSASCWHDPDRAVATASATYVQADGAPG